MYISFNRLFNIFQFHMLKYSISKYFFASILLISCFLLFYTVLILNTCIFGSFKLTLRKYERDSSSINSLNVVRDKKEFNSKTIVRVVPLSWQADIERSVSNFIEHISNNCSWFQYLIYNFLFLEEQH